MRFVLLAAFILTGTPTLAQEKKVVGTASPLPPKGPAASAVRVGTSRGIGSGNVIGRSHKTALILTNKHVIPDGSRKIWVISGGQRYQGRFVAAYGAADLALVAAEISNPASPIGARDPIDGEAVRHFGGATGPQEGKVTGITNWLINGRIDPAIDSDIFSVVGDSGAGIFNSRDELVAVHYARKGDPESDDTIANFVRNEHVRTFTDPYIKNLDTLARK